MSLQLLRILTQGDQGNEIGANFESLAILTASAQREAPYPHSKARNVAPQAVLERKNLTVRCQIVPGRIGPKLYD